MSITAIAALQRGGSFADRDELIVVCCGCQKLRVSPLEFIESAEVLWKRRESISHTLCPDCADRHYGFSRDRYEEIVCRGVRKAS